MFDNLKAKADEQRQKEIDSLILSGEQVEKVFTLIEDYAAITNKRLIYIDKQWTSTKKGINSVPLSKISCVSLTRGGMLSFTKEVEIVVSGKAFELKFLDGKQAQEFYMHLVKASL